MAKVKTAVFPIGGLGTRFLPATKAMPKEMLPIVDKPLIQYAFEEAVAAGVEKFIFITGRNKNTIENHFDHAFELQKTLEQKQKNDILALAKDWLPENITIAFIRQREALGLGHAVLCARKIVNEPFAVLLADELFLSKKPVLKSMVEAYEKLGGNMVGVQEVEREKVKSYGVIEPEGDVSGSVIKVKSMVEKPKPENAPSNYTVSGRYILDTGIFDYLEKQTAGAGGEIQLTDSLNKMAIEKKQTNAFVIDAKRFDCGNRRGFIEANLEFSMNIPEIRSDVIKFTKRILAEYDN
jgi:UTP--glucose-1-phosphate uridylyltransferase